MSALPAGDAGSPTLVPHWLDATARELLAASVRTALAGSSVHPVATIHLQDVLTELHVAAAREAVWPASTARVRLATGWDEDVLPVRLSPAELAAVLGLPALPARLRGLLATGGRS
ncbi:hypothetical protein QOZ88_16815 [Blastococcus sp. BMG 814]|uniref:Uncharacterized protein n=1 Tax=Blastococcus carthaginiensis TaxID=3050034 RepID=A0ABT9IFD3_9ACTN|nr:MULTISPECIES: hypothetical protein [Blastococcus]MDP5184298.1 hypothetical protein [Blastococcus carthaginiensis]SEL17267.1 hypothetical protein SAMN04515665_10951 [Blastococcus sp. DSM 46786]